MKPSRIIRSSDRDAATSNSGAIPGSTFPQSESLGSTGNARPAPDHVRHLRTLGNGRAATAELVEARWADGRTELYVEKVFAPGRLTRCIYRFAFASPFPYQSNHDAIWTCFYRRRVIAEMLEGQAICDRKPASASVALPAYVRYDHTRRAFVLAAEFITGRGPIPTSSEVIAPPLHRNDALSNDAPFNAPPSYENAPNKNASTKNEMSDLLSRMRDVEQSLIDWGLVGSGWQVSPGALVSTANLLIKTHPSLKVFRADNSDENLDEKHLPHERYTIIDLESGIPAVLLWRYVWQSWKQGSLFPFDDLEPTTLRASSQQLADRLVQIGETKRAATLVADVENLVTHDERWKASEIAPFRKPWTWFSNKRRQTYRQCCVDRWQRNGTVDSAFANQLHRSTFRFAWFWIVSLCLLGSAGRWLRSCLANEQHRQRVRKFASHSRTRSAYWLRFQNGCVKTWKKQQRWPRTPTTAMPGRRQLSRISFCTNRILGMLTPAAVHRYCVDQHRRRRRNRQFAAFLTRRGYQIAVGRRAFRSRIKHWHSRGWLSDEHATELKAQFSGPQLAVYSRGLGMHLGIKILYPLMAPLKVGGIAVAVASGNVLFALVPMFALPILRTIVTLYSSIANRSLNVPHRHALWIGMLPTIGSAAFIVQMGATNPRISAFLLRDLAARFARRIPIYGGPNSRTEHAALALTDRWLRLTSTYSQRFHNKNNMPHTSSPESPAPDSSVRYRDGDCLWWPYRNVVRDAFVIASVCCAVLYALQRSLSDAASNPWLTGENGALETLQFFTLVATALVATFAFTRVRPSRYRSIAFALVCVAAAGACREIPKRRPSLPVNVGDLNAAGGIEFVLASNTKHAIIGIAILVWLARVAYGWVKFPDDRRFWFTPSFVWPAIPFACSFALSQFFEHMKWLIAEESIELFAYMMMLTTAAWIVKNASELNTPNLAVIGNNPESPTRPNDCRLKSRWAACKKAG
ncbi:hypothetical protein [Rhodopirellula sallentina]|nr:hypothetical protein [Rhodopirellula sallentina]